MTRPLRGRGPLQDPEMKTMLISGRATRLVRLVAAVGLALGGLALATPAASASMAPAKAGWLRLGHPSPNTPAVDYAVAVRGAGAPPSSKPVLSTTVNIMNGGAYTVAGMGPNSGLRLQVFTDRLAAPRDPALVRVIQASLDPDTVKR